MACDDQLVVLAIQRLGHFGANSLASVLMPAHISSAIERGRGGLQWRAEICCEGVPGGGGVARGHCAEGFAATLPWKDEMLSVFVPQVR